MIWARPLSGADADAQWLRTSLTPQGVGLLSSGPERAVLVTGLAPADRERLAGVVEPCWLPGADAAVVRWSGLAGAALLAVEDPIRLAFERLLQAAAPVAPCRVGAVTLPFGGAVAIMGILNVTPDSFSDGGRYLAPDAAVARARALIDAGALVIDVGGESTRPGAAEVSVEEELRRVVPVVEALRGVAAVISVDTRKPEVARRALAAGAHLINDVNGLRDDAMIEVVAEAGAWACAMHMQGTPQTMQVDPRYDDVGAEVLDTLEAALQRAEARGLPRSRVWVDPGIGFGKTQAHNLFLLRRAADLRLLGCPVLLGVSRKRFIGELTAVATPEARVVGSVTAVALAAAQGAVDVVRVHDVAETRQALAIAAAVRSAADGGSRFTR